MDVRAATAIASPNIALIKYWGNRDADLRIPANDSLSLTLSELQTKTTVHFEDGLEQDWITIDGSDVSSHARARVSGLLAEVRERAGLSAFARVESESNFPVGAGAASSASGFAALALAASSAAGLKLGKRELTILARLGSGSAARSIPGGIVRLHASPDSEGSYAEQILPVEHWPLTDLIAIVSTEHKSVGSTRGHALAATSPLQQARIDSSAERLEAVIHALRSRDFATLASVSELDSNMMHAVMLTSTPPLIYIQPATLRIMDAVRTWREAGEPVFYTIDAGPNVHCITLPEHAPAVKAGLEALPGTLSVLTSGLGAGARLSG